MFKIGSNPDIDVPGDAAGIIINRAGYSVKAHAAFASHILYGGSASMQCTMVTRPFVSQTIAGCHYGDISCIHPCFQNSIGCYKTNNLYCTGIRRLIFFLVTGNKKSD